MTINLRAPGQYHDRETGWYYNGQRYYIPALYRYNRPEPIGQAGSLDLYMYAGGNPVMMVDPTGSRPGPADTEIDSKPKKLLALTEAQERDVKDAQECRAGVAEATVENLVIAPICFYTGPACMGAALATGTPGDSPESKTG